MFMEKAGPARRPPQPQAESLSWISRDSFKAYKKIQFEKNLCYFAFKKTMKSQKVKLLRISSPEGSF